MFLALLALAGAQLMTAVFALVVTRKKVRVG
jgi:hypothetical protein